MAKILILTGGALWSNPRSQKEAAILSSAGHDVTVGGVWFDSGSPERDRDLYAGRQWSFVPVLDFRTLSLAGRIRNVRVRAGGRMAREMFRRSGRLMPSLHGYGASEMVAAALCFRPDLTIVHSEAGLWAGGQLLDRGMKVGVDFEDWYSEDLLPEDRAHKPISGIKALERRHLLECKYCVTASDSLAKALAAQYGGTRPATIYNVFPPPDDLGGTSGADRDSAGLVSFHWFSQTIGPGRGLELLFEALRHVEVPCEIHLRGSLSPSARTWLQSLIPPGWTDRVMLHGVVSNTELPRRIAQHDVGLALESSRSISRDLTITNKLFQYVQAGLAVIATATSGQREVFSRLPHVAQVIPEGDPIGLAAAITLFASNKDRLRVAKEHANIDFDSHFGWPIQRQRMIDRVTVALDSRDEASPAAVQ